MSRLYGPYRCNHCFRTSRLGWVYNCVQDSISDDLEGGDELEIFIKNVIIDDEMLNPEASDPYRGQPGKSSSSVTLTPWIEQAIVDGHYTAQQIAILRTQRLQVEECIVVAQNEYIRGLRLKLNKSGRQPSDAPSDAVDVSNITFPNTQGLSSEVASQKDSPSNVNSQRAQLLSQVRTFRNCDYKTCQVCRPISRDRSWQCLDHVFDSSTAESLPDFATDNRPVSDSNLVRRLGLWKPRPRPQTFESFENILLTDDDKYQTDISRQNSYIGSEPGNAAATGFRASARRAYKGVMVRSRNGSTSSRDSADSRTSTYSLAEKKFKRREHHGHQDGKMDDKGLAYRGERTSNYGFGSKLWRKETQPESSTLGLPDDKMDTQGIGELRVENGIAVTEEGVDLGTADIIMQV
ncbi:hypothetical protein MMC13_003555 [Lambiella insularis]|nr:hypothetical protein [Lambiella insularis]